MTFSGTYLPVSRRTYFTFFNKNALNGAFGFGFGLGFVTQSYYMDENFSFNHGDFELTEIKLKLISAHISNVNFTIEMSSGSDSCFNEILWMQSMNGVNQLIWRPDIEGGKIFLSNDTLNFSMPMSFANIWGLTVSGWSVIDHAMGES